ncbi:MAG: hypothetical protein PHQ28_17425, partial [Mycobacterium sp.]|nr:hypothetical protein [Mycobacterium sp.]
MKSEMRIRTAPNRSSTGRLVIVGVVLSLGACAVGAVASPQDFCHPYSTSDSHVVNGEYANSNYCRTTTMGAGATEGHTARAYVYFDVASCVIPSNASITSANLYLWDAVHVQNGTFCAYA